MERDALSLTHRLHDNSEALIASFAAANYPYAAPRRRVQEMATTENIVIKSIG